MLPYGSDVRPHVSIVTNFTRPTSSTPALLSPNEVNTLLHEFGHAIHSLFSRCRYAALSGTNVARDFVELPSQFNENFMRRRSFLILSRDIIRPVSLFPTRLWRKWCGAVSLAADMTASGSLCLV